MKVQRCSACGRVAFPPRLWCPDCGGDRWDDAEATEGVVETVTTTRDGAILATVVPNGGPPILVRLDEPSAEGDRIRL